MHQLLTRICAAIQCYVYGCFLSIAPVYFASSFTINQKQFHNIDAVYQSLKLFIAEKVSWVFQSLVQYYTLAYLSGAGRDRFLVLLLDRSEECFRDKHSSLLFHNRKNSFIALIPQINHHLRKFFFSAQKRAFFFNCPSDSEAGPIYKINFCAL